MAKPFHRVTSARRTVTTAADAPASTATTNHPQPSPQPTAQPYKIENMKLQLFGSSHAPIRCVHYEGQHLVSAEDVLSHFGWQESALTSLRPDQRHAGEYEGEPMTTITLAGLYAAMLANPGPRTNGFIAKVCARLVQSTGTDLLSAN